MKRYYYICDDLDEFQAMEEELEAKGISRAQIHVISNDDEELERRNLNQVYSWFKTDVMHSTYVGVVVGAIFAAIVIAIAWFFGLREHIGWAPFIFAALVILGFSTWEAGFIGTQIPNTHFRRFQEALDNGEHVLQVDCTPADEVIMQEVVARHRQKIKAAGSENSFDQWAIVSAKKFRQFIKWAP